MSDEDVLPLSSPAGARHLAGCSLEACGQGGLRRPHLKANAVPLLPLSPLGPTPPLPKPAGCRCPVASRRPSPSDWDCLGEKPVAVLVPREQEKSLALTAATG